jgi:uncharacterized protein (DUF952 family)
LEPTTIFHIAQTKDWQKATLTGTYFPASYEQEHFIHCSTIEQVEGVLERYFKNQTVIKLTIDVALLVHPPKYELAPSVNQLFPHIYGPVNLDAVTAVEEITG